MSLPNWVLAIGLMFWGVSVGVWPLALLLAVGIVAPRFVRRRFAFTTAEYSRAMDVCWLLVFGGLLLTYSRESVGSVLRTFAQWLPLVFFPGVLVQAWSESGRIPMGSLLPLPWWRRREHGIAVADVAGPFLVFCVLSASVSGGGRPWFYAGLVAVAWVAFWVSRARGFSPWVAGTFLALAMVGGWGVGVGLGGLQGWFENRFLTWVTQWRRDEGAFRASRTSIGTTGRVGGTGRVVLTVRSEGEARVPLRLRGAVFSAWSDGTWYAPSSPFEKVEGLGGEWSLEERSGLAGSVQVELRTDATGGLLPLPGGAKTIGDCPADSLERTPMGVVRATSPGGMLPYRVDFGTASGWELEPQAEESREVRVSERAAVEAVASELGLAGMLPQDAAERVARHFEEHFRYTTELKASTSSDPRATTPLGRFLLSDREGHCEYFATAGVLLMRSAGVPARYVTGFLVNPADQVNGVYTVRARHAHAWARIWVDGKWRDFDPTPSTLLGTLPVVSRWDRIWNGAWFTITRWWWLGEKRWLREAYWLVAPMLVLTVWRFRRLRAIRGELGNAATAGAATAWPGYDSEWYGVEAGLAAKGWRRNAREAREAWERRLEGETGGKGLGGRIAQVHSLHERLRFDPAGLAPGERAALRRLAEGIRDELGRSREPATITPGGSATTA